MVEIDEAIIRVAKDQFGFSSTSSEKLKVIKEDGLEHIQNLSKFSQGYILSLPDAS